jgi:membrane protein implicated in regulation of membrane protease activity
MDWLSYTYLAGFLIGLVLTVGEFMLGANRNPSGSEREWFSFSALLVGITWFGGTGFVLLAFGLEAWLGLPVALLVGAIGYYFTLRPLQNWESLPAFTHRADKNFEGEVARVTSPVNANEGKIVCTHDGSRHHLEARSNDGQSYPEGAHVVIVKCDQKIAYIEDLNKVLQSAGADKWVIK